LRIHIPPIPLTSARHCGRLTKPQFTSPASVAKCAQRHLDLYDATREQFAEIAIACREHAARNPDAMMRKPITLDDYFNARFAAAPSGFRVAKAVSNSGFHRADFARIACRTVPAGKPSAIAAKSTALWYHPAFASEAPYVVAIVELEEGPRMLTNIVGVSVDQL
jgi:acetyl-CoA acetyltransferase